MGLPTLSFAENFEHGLVGTYAANTGFWDEISGTPQIVTDVVRTGARALEISATGAAEYVGSGTASTIVTQAVYLRLRSLPTALSYLVALHNPNGSGRVSYNPSTGKFGIRGVNLTPVDGGPTVAAGVWYRIVAEYDTSGATAFMRVSVDGQEISSSGAQASANTAAARLGTGSPQTFTCLYDDWLVCEGDGNYELLVLAGRHAVVGLFPSADGVHNVSGANQFEYSGTGVDIRNSSTDVWTLINDAPMDLALSDYVNQVGSGTTNYVEVTFPPLPAGDEAVVRVVGRATTRDAASSGTALGVIRIVLSGTGVGDIRASGHDPGTTVWTLASWLSHPTAGAYGFSREDVNALRCRMGYGDGNPDWYTLSVNLAVALVPDVLGPASLTLALSATAPQVQQGSTGQSVSPSSLSASLTPIGPALSSSVQPSSLSASLAPIGPQVTQSAAPSSLSASLTLIGPSLLQAASPATLTLVLSAPAPQVVPSLQVPSMALSVAVPGPVVQGTSAASVQVPLIALGLAPASPMISGRTEPGLMTLVLSAPAPQVVPSLQVPSMALSVAVPGPVVHQAAAAGAIALLAGVPSPTVAQTILGPSMGLVVAPLAPGVQGTTPSVVQISALAVSLMMSAPTVTAGVGVPGVAWTLERPLVQAVSAERLVQAVSAERTAGGGMVGG